MHIVTTSQIDIQIPAPEPSFQIDGKVIEILPGSGLATVRANSSKNLTVNRGTDGVHFEELRIGDWVNCEVAVASHRVLYAHQQTMPLEIPVSKP